jgi:hypothetical protein
VSNYEEKVKLCEKAKYAVFPEEICGAQDVFSQAWNHQQKKIDALEKKLAEAVELIDCTSDRWGKCKCRSCEFLKSLEEEKEAQGE